MFDIEYRYDSDEHCLMIDELYKDEDKFIKDFIKWEEKNQVKLATYYILDKETDKTYDIWAKAKYIINMVNLKHLQDEINELTEPAIFTQGN